MTEAWTIDRNSKVYEKPDTGEFLATIIDVINMGEVAMINLDGTPGKQFQAKIVWVLDKNDSEGKPFRVTRQINASMHEKANLYKICAGVLGAEPPIPFHPEELMGRSNKLYLVKTWNKAHTKQYAKIMAFLPLPEGTVGPKAPVGFVRDKDKPKQAGTAPSQPLPTSKAPVEEEVELDF